MSFILFFQTKRYHLIIHIQHDWSSQVAT
jgi:hypothetical protein